MQRDSGETANLADEVKLRDVIDEHARLLANRLAIESPKGLKLLDPAKGGNPRPVGARSSSSRSSRP
jgi:hypothetical protein